ncbi:unnamed protein product [[Actinomadura] parvosata subsp. kistnae]|uniref:Uncharacterized protein n=1 Tax=[Actinomadura] parvosata subsp. kistnae TaxID=1909395 RepID=A0A1U9ZZM7_9ACTN|nr:hypothetical protein [Nonomuraea sp. ATCC 55076]AQZ63387.1 hypothetical protein BKM31_19685 [Nonomuraea sp. ATCC 55076]SPL99105.1 unnamed protein product [Actinomadura parvosata subsp. kistnae]
MSTTLVKVIQTVRDCDLSQWDAWTADGQYLCLRYQSGLGTVDAYDTADWRTWSHPPYGSVAEFGEPGPDGAISLEDFCAAAGLLLAPGALNLRFGCVPEVFGDCTVSRDADGTYSVTRADPRLHISAGLLQKIAAGEHEPGVLTGDPARIAACARGEHHRDGPDMVLTIDATNRRVIYRISTYEFQPDWYLAEWPD